MPPMAPSKHAVSARLVVNRPRRGRPQMHPRYEICVSGCSHANYKIVTEDQRAKYREVLRMSDFVLEHPRKDTLPQVMQLKLVFALGPNSYSWIKSAVLNPEDYQEDGEDTEERCIVGHLDSEEDLDSDSNMEH